MLKLHTRVLHASWLASHSRLTASNPSLVFPACIYTRSLTSASSAHGRVSSMSNDSRSSGQVLVPPTTTGTEETLDELEAPTTASPSTSTMQTDPEKVDLTTLSPTELIARINELEARLRSTTAELGAFTSKSSTTKTGTGAEVDGLQSPGGAGRFKKKNKDNKKKEGKPIDFDRYHTRHIALKFAYLGHRYNGFEHSNGAVAPPKPTIEEALWKALRKARLIPTDVAEGCDGSFSVVFDERDRAALYGKGGVKLALDWTGLAYSKCGRTDKGVSAFGQVVGIRVRSSRRKERVDEGAQPGTGTAEEEEKHTPALRGRREEFDDVRDELPYVSMLNSVLPPDIRVLACYLDPDPAFDARFSCRGRKYKYFFTNPAFLPTPGAAGLRHGNGEPAPVREGWLDVEAMRRAAKKLEGLHDFRNMCKIDASKQMSSCVRRITFTDIEECPDGGLDLFTTGSGLGRGKPESELVNRGIESASRRSERTPSEATPKVYAFVVHGSAFLWHQVRCMVAILFLVGQGLEKPELIDQLLDIVQTPGRPHYEMADDTPLVLWDCFFPSNETDSEDGMNWIYSGDAASIASLSKRSESQFDGKFGIGGLVTGVWTQWREAKMKEILTAGLLGLALNHGDGSSLERGGLRVDTTPRTRSQRIFDGGDSSRIVGGYIPVMRKQRQDTLEEQNAKWLATKQARVDRQILQPSENE